MPRPAIPFLLALLGACATSSAQPPAQHFEPAADLPQQADSGTPELELPRRPSLSPDGTRIAFGHQGDIWVADVADGQARRLTGHDAHDGRAMWSPDGKWLAFTSNRHGNYDVFLIPAAGGVAERITWHREGERLLGWLDQDRILIGAQADRRYSRRDRGIWVAYRDGRTPTILGDWAMQQASFDASQRWLAYERGHGSSSRRAYRGPACSSLWVWDAEKDEHRSLTTFDGNDLAPMMDPAGEWVYFLSDRACAGNEEGRDLGLWRIPRKGGKASLVYHPGGRSLRNASMGHGGRSIVAELDLGLVRIDLPSGNASPVKVYGSVDTSDLAAETRTQDSGVEEFAVSPDGKSIAFTADGDIYVMRRHEDIRRCVRVTTHPAPEYAPVWVEDGNALLFISEREGNGEVYRVRTAGTPAPKPEAEKEEKSDEEEKPEEELEITPFWLARDFEVERLTTTAEDESALGLSPDGKTLAWVVGNGKLVVGDPATLKVSREITDGYEAPDFDWSPDSRWLAYSQGDDDFNYDVFLVRADIEGMAADEPGAQPYNLTRHPDDDTGPIWSPDGRKLTFTSRRMMSDETDVWVAFLRSADDERTKRERLEAAEAEKKAKEKEKKAKDKGKGKGDDQPAVLAEAQPADAVLSGEWQGLAEGPDPVMEKGLPFTMRLVLRGEMVYGEVESLLFSGVMGDLSWDSKAQTLEFTLAIPDTDGVKGSLTVAGDRLTGWVDADSSRFDFSADRSSSTSGVEEAAAKAFQEAPAEEEKAGEKEEVPEVEVDWEDLNRRVRRLTRREGNERAVGWDGGSEKVYFNATVGTRLTNDSKAETGFFHMDIFEGKEESVAGSPVQGFALHDKKVHTIQRGTIHEGKKSYGFSVRVREDRMATREAVLEQTWRFLDRNFYDPGFHGHDWAASLEKWRPAVMAATCPEDYGEMVNWMLGEMNASHMGYYSYGRSAASQTDNPSMGLLGVLWDETFEGPGRKVREVLPGTPAARSISSLRVGDVVLRVDGEPYQAGDNWHRLMSGTAGQEVLLDVVDADGQAREVLIRPTSSLSDALYRRAERICRDQVEADSEGRVGYVHIESMSTGPLEDFERELFDAGHGKDALIIDVRENGGGWTTDMVLAMLTVRDHARTIPRNGGEGYPQGRRIFATWTKPIVVLCNENSYSNAEIFSWSIKTLGRGPVVGKQTYGAVISTGGTTLLDGSFVRLPFRGWYVNDADKTNMELNGCPPDYPVENLPGDFKLGIDRQLEKAIEVALKQL